MNLNISKENIKSLLNQILGSAVSISYKDENFLSTNNYDVLGYTIDDCYIQLGEKNNEYYDIKILIHRIKTIESIDENIIKIKFFDEKEILFVF